MLKPFSLHASIMFWLYSSFKFITSNWKYEKKGNQKIDKEDNMEK